MRMIEVIRIDPDGTAEVVSIEPTLENCRAQIGGGYLEGLRPMTLDHGEWLAYVDEEGHVKGLPPNPLASDLLALCGYPRRVALRGPVLFMGVRGGSEVAVPPQVASALLALVSGAPAL